MDHGHGLQRIGGAAGRLAHADAGAVVDGIAHGIDGAAVNLHHHLGIAHEAAGGEDDGFAVDLVGGAVIITGLDANDLAVVIEDELFGGQLGHEIVLLVLGFGEIHGAGELEGLVRPEDVPAGFGVGAVDTPLLIPGGNHEGAEQAAALELEAEVLDIIIQGGAGLVDGLVDDVGLLIAADIVEPDLVDLVGIDIVLAIVKEILEVFAVEGHGAVGADGVAADLAGSLDAEDGGTLIGRGAVGHDAGAAEADDDDVVAVDGHRVGALLNRGVPLVRLAAGLVDRAGNAVLDAVGGGGGAGDGIDTERLGLEQAGNEQLLGIGKPLAGGGVGLFDDGNVGDGAVLEGDLAGHLAGDAEAGCGALEGAVLNGGLLGAGGIALGLGQGLGQGADNTVGRLGGTGDAVDLGTLGLENLGLEGGTGSAADGGRLFGDVDRDIGDGVFIDRDRDGQAGFVAAALARIGTRRVETVGQGRRAEHRQAEAENQRPREKFFHGAFLL